MYFSLCVRPTFDTSICNELKKKKTFCGFSMGRNQYWAGRVYDLCVYYMTGTPEGSTESGFMEKPGIEPATPGIDFLLGYAVTCSFSHARVQELMSRKLQVCKVLGGGSIIFQVIHLLISMETYITCGFQGHQGPDPLLSLGPAHASSLKLSSHTYVFFTLC